MPSARQHPGNDNLSPSLRSTSCRPKSKNTKVKFDVINNTMNTLYKISEKKKILTPVNLKLQEYLHRNEQGLNS